MFKISIEMGREYSFFPSPCLSSPFFRTVLWRDHARLPRPALHHPLRHRLLQPLGALQQVRLLPDPLLGAQPLRLGQVVHLPRERQRLCHRVRHRVHGGLPLRGRDDHRRRDRAGPGVRGGHEGARPHVPDGALRRDPGHGSRGDLGGRRHPALLQHGRAGPGARAGLLLLAEPRPAGRGRRRAGAGRHERRALCGRAHLGAPHPARLLAVPDGHPGGGGLGGRPALPQRMSGHCGHGHVAHRGCVVVFYHRTGPRGTVFLLLSTQAVLL